MTMLQILAGNAPQRAGIPAPVNTVAPAISGTSQVDSILSVSTGTWVNGVTSYSYQWYQTGIGPISGATSSSYTVLSTDNGKTLYCVVTATNAGGSTSANSNTTSTVTFPAPVNTTAPTLSGYSTVGNTLTVNNGSWNYSPTSYTYKWYNNAGVISGATLSSYTTTSSDVGYQIRALVTATNSTGSTSIYSNYSSTSYAIPSNVSAPSNNGVRGVGMGISVNSYGSWNGSPTSYDVYWYRSNGAFAGYGNPTYTIQAADAGYCLRALVYAYNSNDLGCSGCAYTAYTQLIGYRPSNSVAPTISGCPYSGCTLTLSLGTWNCCSTYWANNWYRYSGGLESTIGSTLCCTYVIQATDIGACIRVGVYASNQFGDCTVYTPYTSTISQLKTASVEYLVVGGGGAGGRSYGGGGGAGGYLTATGYAVTPGSAITVTVGGGGAGGTYASLPSCSGTCSVFGAIIAYGGGRGGSYQCCWTGASGGSGGGSSTPGIGSYVGGAACPGQGNAGGPGCYYSWPFAGGGGGAGCAGISFGSFGCGGSGGRGLCSSITGTCTVYAAGGGGGGIAIGCATSTIAGNGGNCTVAPTSASPANRGSGGGGPYNQFSSGSGSSGVVIIRYSNIYANAASTTGSPTYTNSGGYKIYTWTGSGSITF